MRVFVCVQDSFIPLWLQEKRLIWRAMNAYAQEQSIKWSS